MLPKMHAWLAAAALLVAAAAILPMPAAADPQSGNMTVTSFDGTAIDIMVCKPASASATNKAPVILHSHGWAGSRSNCGFGDWLAAGIGVVSISQRGHGASGGEAHVHDPEYEGRDNMAVIDRVAQLDWVLLDGPGDPVMGAIGGSYGGGYQLITALAETQATGSTRFNALAPEITWNDLPRSLAPSKVVRTAWVSALYAAGAANVHQGVHEAYVYAMATGQLPDGTVPGVYDIISDFAGNSPRAFSEAGVKLDVPVLFRQGITDNLFNLNEGWHNFEEVLTPDAKAQSYLIGYNGGHALPNVMPLGVGGGADPCSAPYGGFGKLSIAFYRNVFFGQSNPMPPKAYGLATVGDRCLWLDSLAPTGTAVPMLTTLAVATGGGAPVHVPLVTGPATIAGISELRATLTTVGVDQRAFVALSLGTTPADARVLANNMMPIQQTLPALQEPIAIEMAGLAVEVPAGQTLYLTLSPVSDMSFAHGSRTPGVMVLTDVNVALPLRG